MLTVHFLDVGQGDAALLLCDGHAMLIDGGNVADSRLVVAYLKEQKIAALDYVIATHGHEDHVGGLAGVLHIWKAGTVFCPVADYNSTAFLNFKKYAGAQGKEITIPTPGTTFSLGSASVEILGPLTYTGDANNDSIVLRVDFGATSFLFTGDIQREAEESLLESGSNLAATVLKVGHHGSASSSSYRFLREVLPSYAVISVGADNSYGHPEDAVLSRLRDAGITLYRTDLQGHITAFSDGSSVSFSVEKNPGIAVNPTLSDGSGQRSVSP